MGVTRYACITPARDEAHNLPRLAKSLAEQTVPPELWLIVDNGSTDGTDEVVRTLAEDFPAVRLLQVDGDPTAVRGAPIALGSVGVGAKTLNNVSGYVVDDGLDVSLLGQSFLARIPTVRIAGDALTLE